MNLTLTEAQRAMVAMAVLLAETAAADLRHAPDHPLGVRHAIERLESIKSLLVSL